MAQKIQFSRKTAAVAGYAAALAAAQAKKPLYGEPVVIKYTENAETFLALFIGIDGNGKVHEVGSYKDIASVKTAVETLSGNVGSLDSLTTSSKTSIVEAINEVNERATSAVENSVTRVVAGKGISVDSTDNTAPQVSAKVATSETGNILVVDETKGLYATLDFSYSAETQKLTLTGSNGFSKEVNLAIPAVVSSGAYDAANNEIVLTFTDGSTVKIPARDLIDEWKVASTATLELIRESAGEGNIDYVLKGNVKVSAESGNTLVAKADGLYVAATDLSGLTARVVALENTVGNAESGLVKAVADNAAAAAAAQTAADNAAAAAATADAKAVAAQGTADNAVTKADNAAAAASAAQTAAETADGKAVAAQNTANANATALATIKVKDVDGTSTVKNENGIISVNIIDGGEF